ncbi:MAG: OmpA family protein [Pseudomonadota bacterium]
MTSGINTSKRLRLLALAALGVTVGATTVVAQDPASKINDILDRLAPNSTERPIAEPPRRFRVPAIVRRRSKRIPLDYRIHARYRAALPINFDFASARIPSSERAKLHRLGLALESRRARGRRYLLIGHTDSSGSRFRNQVLSERRAASVLRYLIQNYRIDPGQLVPLGFGEEQTIAGIDPRSWRNRRVEVILLAR